MNPICTYNCPLVHFNFPRSTLFDFNKKSSLKLCIFKVSNPVLLWLPYEFQIHCLLSIQMQLIHWTQLLSPPVVQLVSHKSIFTHIHCRWSASNGSTSNFCVQQIFWSIYSSASGQRRICVAYARRFKWVGGSHLFVHWGQQSSFRYNQRHDKNFS